MTQIQRQGSRLRCRNGRLLRCDCEPQPSCDYWLQALLCEPQVGCQNATPEVYVRCDFRCRSGSGTVLQIGPWGLCYTIANSPKFVENPGTGVPPPPGFEYLPDDAWIVPQIEFDCRAQCSPCPANPSLWYQVQLCACSPNPSGLPFYLDCVTYHDLIEQVRSFRDPLACYAFSAQAPNGQWICFTLGGGVIHANEPPGHRITGASVIYGGCCECPGCNPPCVGLTLEEIRESNGEVVFAAARRCCCNQDTAVSTSRIETDIYTPPSTGHYRRFNIVHESTLDGVSLRRSTIQTEYNAQGQIIDVQQDSASAPGWPRCDRLAVLQSSWWARSSVFAPYVAGTWHRDCAGASANYQVTAFEGGTNPYLERVVVGLATFTGDLGPCTGGCSPIPGVPLDPTAPAPPGGGDAPSGRGGGCAGCGHSAGPGSTPGQIERMLAEGLA